MLTERYDSFLRIAQSTTVCLIFLQIQYNKYLAKIISFFGPLIFGVYLIHNHKLMKENISKHIFDDIPKSTTFRSLLGLIIFRDVKIFIICIFIDYIRHLLFTLLQIRKILLFFEDKIKYFFH